MSIHHLFRFNWFNATFQIDFQNEYFFSFKTVPKQTNGFSHRSHLSALESSNTQKKQRKQIFPHRKKTNEKNLRGLQKLVISFSFRKRFHLLLQGLSVGRQCKPTVWKASRNWQCRYKKKKPHTKMICAVSKTHH